MKCDIDICDIAKDIVKSVDEAFATSDITKYNFMLKPLRCNEPHELNVNRGEWETYSQFYKEMLIDTYYKFPDDDMLNATK